MYYKYICILIEIFKICTFFKWKLLVLLYRVVQSYFFLIVADWRGLFTNKCVIYTHTTLTKGVTALNVLHNTDMFAARLLVLYGFCATGTSWSVVHILSQNKNLAVCIMKLILFLGILTLNIVCGVGDQFYFIASECIKGSATVTLWICT